MPDYKAINEAREKLEAALQEWVRLSRENDEHMFIQDYTISVSAESMEPGKENMNFMNFICRPNMASYQVVGLLRAAEHYWLNQGHRE
jgi:hypothetical protein